MIETVLFVDDEPSVGMIAQLALGDLGGMHVELAATGAEALRVAATRPPDLIVLDVVLPDMDGPDVYASLRAEAATAETPIIFCTGRTDANDHARLLALGALGVIAKPLDPMQLAAQVRAIVDGAR